MPTTPRLPVLAVIKLRSGKMAEFSAVMEKVVPIMEQFGWRLEGAWTNVVGRLYVVYDLWTVPDANGVMGGFAGLMQRLEYPEIARVLSECVEDEQLQLLAPLPFDPGRI